MKEEIRKLDMIDVSLYLIYEDTKKIMKEINFDYNNVCKNISAKEFEQYVKERYCI